MESNVSKVELKTINSVHTNFCQQRATSYLLASKIHKKIRIIIRVSSNLHPKYCTLLLLDCLTQTSSISLWLFIRWTRPKEQKKAFAIRRDAYCAERLTGLMARHTSDARSINPNCIKPLLLLRVVVQCPKSRRPLLQKSNLDNCEAWIFWKVEILA